MKRATLLAFCVPVLFVWIAFSFPANPDPNQAHPVIQALLPALWFGVPLGIASVIITRRVVVVADGRDFPARLLSVTTASLPATKVEWGAAMRAELDCIEDSRQRRRFALWSTVAAARLGIDRRTLTIALAAAGVVAIGTLIASRVTLANSQGGVLGYSFLGPQLLLAFVGLTGSARRSFRAGVQTGLMATGLALLGMLAVQVFEAGNWFDQAGVHIVDGDPPKDPLTRTQMMLDPIAPVFVVLYLVAWLPWPVIGAAIGSKGLRTRRQIDVSASSMV